MIIEIIIVLIVILIIVATIVVHNINKTNRAYCIYRSIYADVWEESYGWFLVRNFKNKYNYINVKGKLISEEWFDKASIFSNGFAMIQRDNEVNYIDTKGYKLLHDSLPAHIYRLYPFNYSLAIIRRCNGDTYEYNLIDTEGIQYFSEWKDNITYNPRIEAFKIEKGNCSNIIKHGTLIFDHWLYTG